MCILAIYFSPFGIYRNSITFQGKQEGMLHGLYEANGGLLPGNRYQGQGVNRRQRRQRAQQAAQPPVFKPVFKTNPVDALKKLFPNTWRDWIEIFQSYFDDQRIDYWEPFMSSGNVSLVDEISREIQSEMTAREWCHTPWHLHHLPFQKQNAVFSQGEAFSTGCIRCLRPFYEHEFLYYTVEQKATYLTNTLFQRKDDALKARIPIHDPQFWSAPAAADEPRPTRRTKKKALPVAPPNDADEARDAATLGQEWPSVRLYPANIVPADVQRLKVFRPGGLNFASIEFRKYYSPSFGIGGRQQYDDTQVQGYVMSREYAKRGFRVTRSHKFGNCCLDCRSAIFVIFLLIFATCSVR